MKLDVCRSLAVTLGLAAACASSAPAFAAENPMENVGRLHNVYLDCLVNRGVSNDASMLRRVIEECGYRPETGDTAEFVARYSSMLPVDPSATVVQRMKPYKSEFSDYVFSFFERIDRVITSAANREEAAREFTRLEREAVANLDPRSRSGKAVLSGLSVSLYSLEYWSDYYEVQLRAEGSTEVKAAKLRWWVRVLVTVGADLVGGAVGGPGLGAVTSGGALAAMN